MSHRTLILHGWGGSDAPHWQAELASSLAKSYGTVNFPLLDNCHFPSKNRWIRQTKEILQQFQPHTVVCHSLANTLWFWLCEEGEIAPIENLIMVAPPSLHTTHNTIKSFFPTPMPSSLYTQKSHIILSDNDPWIELEEAQNLAKHYQTSLTIIPNGKHLNTEAGYGKWELIENLVQEIQHDFKH
jgi:hypothetical protein